MRRAIRNLLCAMLGPLLAWTIIPIALALGAIFSRQQGNASFALDNGLVLIAATLIIILIAGWVQ